MPFICCVPNTVTLPVLIVFCTIIGLTLLSGLACHLRTKLIERSKKKRKAALPPEYSLHPPCPDIEQLAASVSSPKPKYSLPRFQSSWFRFDNEKSTEADKEFCTVCHHRQNHRKCKRTYVQSMKRKVVLAGYCKYCDQRTDHVQCLWSMGVDETVEANRNERGILGNGNVVVPPGAVLKHTNRLYDERGG